MKKSKKRSWFEQLFFIAENVLILESYYRNFRDARDSVDRLIDLRRLNQMRSPHPYQ